MIDISLYTEIEKDKKKLKSQVSPSFATVVETGESGVKIRIDGEDQAREIFYNSLQIVNAGDRVYITNCSGEILILGKLQYMKGMR